MGITAECVAERHVVRRMNMESEAIFGRGKVLEHAARNLSEDERHYEREDIVATWLGRYELEKERKFIESLDRCIPRNLVTLLDIGCGTGLHSWLWSQTNKRVAASDFSTRFRDHILRTYSFPFIWADVLNCDI